MVSSDLPPEEKMASALRTCGIDPDKTIGDYFKESEEAGLKLQDSIRGELRNSDHGALKLFAYDWGIPLGTAAIVAGIGRATNIPDLIVAPIVIDLFFGGAPMHSGRAVARSLGGYAKYGLGVAAVYADKVLPQVYEFARNLIDRL